MRAKAWRMLFAGRRWMLWLPAGVGMAGNARMAVHPYGPGRPVSIKPSLVCSGAGVSFAGAGSIGAA